MRAIGGKAGQTPFSLGQAKHGKDMLIFPRIPPSVKRDPLGKMKMPAYLFKRLHGHILEYPLLPENLARADPAFQGAVCGGLNLECLKATMCFCENVCQSGEHVLLSN